MRTQFKTFLTTNAPTENYIDLTADFRELRLIISSESLQHDDPWMGVEFIGSDEVAFGLTATNTAGLYRETGTMQVHIVEPVNRDVDTMRNNLLTRAETLRNLLRGRRINDIVVDNVTPPNTGAGATLQFEGGYQSASFTVGYYRDKNL